ncbi:MAG: tetratricopeptide repeat protein [Anaerolineae bacterium]|nr:tetratricopeptide repeat protein [Anaerolineae bacterium]
MPVRPLLVDSSNRTGRAPWPSNAGTGDEGWAMRARLPLLVLILTGMGLRLWRLDADSFWLDELIQVYLAGLPVRRLIPAAFTHANLPLDILVTKAFLRLGAQDGWLRLAPALGGVLFIPLAWVLARRLSDRTTALTAATLAALSPAALQYAREVRPYTTLLVLVTLAGYLYLRARARPWAWPAFALALLTALHTHLFALALVPVFGFHWLLADGRRRAWPAPFLLAGVTALAVVSPLTPDYIGRFLRAVWQSTTAADRTVGDILGLPGWAVGFPGWGTVLGRLFADLGGTPWAGTPTLALALFGAYHLHRRGWRPGLLLGWLALTPAPILYALLARGQWYSPRYLIAVVPPLLVLTAAGIGGLATALAARMGREGRMVLASRRLAVVLLAVYLGLTAPALARALHPAHENLRAAAAAIAADYAPTTLVVAPVVGTYLGHYLPEDVVVHDLRDGGAVEALARDYERVIILDTAYSPLRWPHAPWINPDNRVARFEPGVTLYRGPAGLVAAQQLAERRERERADPRLATATPEQLRRLAVTARSRQAWPTAAAALERLTTLQPDDAEAWTEYGFALQQLRAYEEAVAAYERALVLDPNRAWAHLLLANTLRLQGRPAAGLAHARRATELQPGLADAWLSLARVAVALDDEETAWNALRTGLETAPGHSALLSALAGLAVTAPAERAERYWQFILDHQPPPDLAARACAWLGHAHPACSPFP